MSDAAILAWMLGTYLLASIPFSVIIGRMIFGVDIRQYGDGNPGATNVYRASKSKAWFIIALLLDGFKGLFPVGIAYWMMGLTSPAIIAIASAAIFGHAFSIFLRFNGGKAVAITGGIWTGLTIMEAPFVLAVLLVYCYRSVDSSDWAVVLWMLSYLLYLLLAKPGNLIFLSIWAVNFLVLLYRHRDGLRQPPQIRRWLPVLSKAG